jgi:type II protein arginine methyltransferase
MLNDSARNSAFKKALDFWVRYEEKTVVIDIGSGTGLLSLYAANISNIKNVYAVEADPIMSQISSDVFKENCRGELVKLIEKHSMDLKVGETLPSKVSLIVTETLDAAVFGEGILDTLIDAKKNLLEPNGRIIPWKVKIFVAGFSSMSLMANQTLLNDTIREYLFLDNVQLVGKHDEPYDSEYVDSISDFKLVTSTASTIEVDFNDLDSMEKHFDGSTTKSFEVESKVKNDYIDGFITWFKLYLDEKDEENFILTEPKAKTCWNQAIFKLKERILLEKDQLLELSISCKNGILELQHDIDETPETEIFEVDPCVLKFLNDEDYLRELEFAVSKHDHKLINGLDLSPFPYVGILLLKESRLEKLWCLKSIENLAKLIAKKNLIDESKFVFIEDIENVTDTKFELIILNLFHPLGDLENELICKYSSFHELLTANGLMIPCKISLHGELVNSDWLVDSCKVTDAKVKELKIDKFINDFATEVFLDLHNTLECERLTGLFKISNIYFDDKLHESTISVPMKNTNLPVHAIFFHHQVQFSSKVPEYSTKRNSPLNFFGQYAHVFKSPMSIESVNAKLICTQNCGIVKCDIA